MSSTNLQTCGPFWRLIVMYVFFSSNSSRERDKFIGIPTGRQIYYSCNPSTSQLLRVMQEEQAFQQQKDAINAGGGGTIGVVSDTDDARARAATEKPLQKEKIQFARVLFDFEARNEEVCV